jgi:hypothetical protein
VIVQTIAIDGDCPEIAALSLRIDQEVQAAFAERGLELADQQTGGIV